jgi:hypothetical protein
MITLPLSTGKELNLKTSWQDFTLQDYITVLDSQNHQELLLMACGLTDVEFDALDIYAREIIFDCLFYLNTPMECMAIAMPFEDIGEESVGQLEDCKAVIRQNPGYNSAHFVYAIYMQKQRDGFYDEKKAYTLAGETLLRPVTEVWNHIAFFFKRLSVLIRSMPSSPSTSQSPNSLMRASTGFRSLVSLPLCDN